MKKVKEHYKDINSTVARLSLVAIQVVIAISVFQFIRFVFFQDMANWQLNVVSFAGSLVAAMTAFLLLSKYQKLVQEFSLQNESLERLVKRRGRTA